MRINPVSDRYTTSHPRNVGPVGPKVKVKTMKDDTLQPVLEIGMLSS